MKAWRSRASFEAGTAMYRWLYVIMRNCAANDHHRETMAKRLKTRLARETPLPTSEPLARLEVRDVYRAIAALPAEQREILLLISMGHVDYDGAAELLGRPANTLKSRVRRARLALTRRLAGPTNQADNVSTARGPSKFRPSRG